VRATLQRAWRVVLAVGLAVAATGSMAALSQVTYAAYPGDDAELRLTWRARAAPAQECRRLTDEERDALPAHMRRDVVCEGRVASYRLDVVVDGRVTHRSVVKGAGARGDRPLYVFETIRLPPGAHEVRVLFERVATGPGDAATDASPSGPELAGAGSPDSEAARSTVPDGGSTSPAHAGAVPDRLELIEWLELAAGEVALVTFDATDRRLVLRRAQRG
jgi:hypothetical protein